MATVDIKIFKHHKKADGTYNVKIRVTHKKDRRYFDTSHFVSERQLTSNLTVKDAFLKKLLNSLLDSGEKDHADVVKGIVNFRLHLIYHRASRIWYAAAYQINI